MGSAALVSRAAHPCARDQARTRSRRGGTDLRGQSPKARSCRRSTGADRVAALPAGAPPIFMLDCRTQGRACVGRIATKSGSTSTRDSPASGAGRRGSNRLVLRNRIADASTAPARRSPRRPARGAAGPAYRRVLGPNPTRGVASLCSFVSACRRAHRGRRVRPGLMRVVPPESLDAPVAADRTKSLGMDATPA